MVLYLRQTVVLPNVGPNADAYTPYILSVFFFILFANLVGLIPYGSTATGNVSVTATMAIISFVVIEISGMRALGAEYWKTIVYWNTDLSLPVRIPMALILTPIEIISKLTKPFALTIRLFANMTAGHVVHARVHQPDLHVPELLRRRRAGRRWASPIRCWRFLSRSCRHSFSRCSRPCSLARSGSRRTIELDAIAPLRTRDRNGRSRRQGQDKRWMNEERRADLAPPCASVAGRVAGEARWGPGLGDEQRRRHGAAAGRKQLGRHGRPTDMDWRFGQ